MGSGGVYALASLYMDGVVAGVGECVVRQVGMQIERADVVEQPPCVEIAEGGQGAMSLVVGSMAGRSPHLLITGTSRAVMSERVYWLNRCWRGTRRSP